MSCASNAQVMIIRWINAAFRLMWLEAVPGKTPEEMETEMIGQNMLTQEEWDKIASLSSRCTHIYQWISDVLSKLLDMRYIASGEQLVMMQKQVDDMRGANVWGLPSLPLTYTQIITHMVKIHLFMLAISDGASAAMKFQHASEHGYRRETIIALILLHLDLALHHYLFQGLLDLHGALYNPNSGTSLGHLPALNFMDFVQDVTEHLNSENDALPYKLNLVEMDEGSGASLHELGQHGSCPKHNLIV